MVAKVALGEFGVGVQDKGVRDLEPVGHLHVHPCRPTYEKRQRELIGWTNDIGGVAGS